ncbi:HepT-like ribonuclease domain-containing protein [Lunatimonas salinarum]|uniref:HepT-like ribonuclease domain-containing protein n=1 Tax=Lunatimonas salinarum TaxID=1774590 RepID=UPI001ADFB1DA|nr:HepT-like ribonuclease domain-containing protein [Lunatimonas salinarum]
MKRFDDRRSAAAVAALLQAIAQISHHVQQVSQEEFRSNTTLQDAVFFQLSVISEKVQDIDRFFLDRYDYPWYQLKTFRKLMLNDKFHVRVDAVWLLIEKDLPDLKKTLEMMKSGMKHG